MSLLMDALKKAELAKSRSQPGNASASTPASTEPTTALQAEIIDYKPETQVDSASVRDSAPGNYPAGSQLPTLPDKLELLDSEFDTSPRPASKREEPMVQGTGAPSLSMQDIGQGAAPRAAAAASVASAAADSSEREAVQNLFETKKTAPSRKNFAIAAGGLTLLAAAGIGFYVWSEMQPKSGLMPRGGQLPPPRPVASTAAPIVSPAAPATAPLISGLEESKLPAAESKKEAANDAAEPTAAPVPVKKLFHVTAATPVSNQSLDRAYSAFARGDNTAARAGYEQVLSGDPKNADALAGLAAIADRTGNGELAADYYLQMLDADPKNASALAGLANLQSRIDPNTAETRLKQALSSQPDSGALNFGLGNIYARSKRWNDAQQAYFKAMAGDPGNPDYLFNLAVSLDQLRQPKLAAKYYALAIAAAESRPAAFDKAQANDRLQKLQQQP